MAASSRAEAERLLSPAAEGSEARPVERRTSAGAAVAAGMMLMLLLAGTATFMGARGGRGGAALGGGVGADSMDLPLAQTEAADLPSAGTAAATGTITAPDGGVVEALLGRSHHPASSGSGHHSSHHASDKDDAERDKTYIVPSIVIDKLAAKLGGSKKHPS